MVGGAIPLTRGPAKSGGGSEERRGCAKRAEGNPQSMRDGEGRGVLRRSVGVSFLADAG